MQKQQYQSKMSMEASLRHTDPSNSDVSNRFAALRPPSVKNTHENRTKKIKKVQNHIAVTSRMVLFYFNFRGFAKRLKRTLLFGSRFDVT